MGLFAVAVLFRERLLVFCFTESGEDAGVF